VILFATESRPCGKIILAAGVLICFHFKEEGSPPKTWEYPREVKKAIDRSSTNLGILCIFAFVKLKVRK
jgi:hypothetical protein